MLKKSALLLIALAVFNTIHAQEKWDLRKCVDYAISNNISVKQADLQARFSELTLKQGYQSRWPTLNFSNNYSFRYGRAENPSTGVLEDNNFFNINLGLNSSVTIFNWFSKKNTNEANLLNYEADKAQVKKIQDDIALNVAVAYLQVLLSKEQVNLARAQTQLTSEQLADTRKRVEAGVLPELNAAELEAQLARDSSGLVSAESTVLQFLLQLKAVLNLDAGADFDIVVPSVDRIPVEPISELQPEAVFALALANLPQQKVIDLRIRSAKKSVEAARGQLYPSIAGFASLGTNYVNFKDKPIYNQVLTGYAGSLLRADAGGGVYYPVELPVTQPGNTVIQYIKPDNFGSQLNANFGQGFGIGISVPIFNGGFARANWERSRLTVKQWELTKEQDNQTLKQDIYKAYNDAIAALQKFYADKKSVETAQKSFDFAERRYELNLLSTFELVNSQTNLLRARIQSLYSQYDYLFKMKLLEFYKGQGLKL